MNLQAKARWLKFWQALPAGRDPEPYFAQLAACYAEPHRAYHNLAHIMDCLCEFDSSKDLAHDAPAVEMALWFHDVVYDPRAKDNEERSAGLALKVADEAGVSASFKESVKALILSTKKHDDSLHRDAAVMADIDLGILGRAPDRFDEYENQIRQEYEWGPAAAFAAGRSAILEAFLARRSIYGTGFFRNKYERQARENLERSIGKLRGHTSN
jgi:predicted metal-dependent HD superfamily phosphohydrolase